MCMVAGTRYALVMVMVMAILPPLDPSYTHPRHHHHRGVAAPATRLYYTHLINIHTHRHREDFFKDKLLARELCTTLAILFGSLWPTSRQEKFKNYHIYLIPTFLDICILVLKIQYSRDTNSCRSATGSPQSSSVFITSFYVFSRQSRVALVEAGILMVD